MVAIISPAAVQVSAQQIDSAKTQSSTSQSQNNLPTSQSLTSVHLRWEVWPGVLRYRLQLAQDREFKDIVFDRVVAANEYEITDLLPGRYFWRVAPLTTKLGQFSLAVVIDVGRESKGIDSRNAKQPAATAIAVGDGWSAAIGDVAHPVVAHLRSPDVLDVVAVNSSGVVFALDANSGIALWTARVQRTKTTPTSGPPIGPLTIRSASGLDNLVVLSGASMLALEGASGRELWRGSLPGSASNGVAAGDLPGSLLFIIDNSLQKLFLVDSANGNLITETRLPYRAFGPPVRIDYGSVHGVMIASQDGRVEIRDRTGKTIRSGDAGSPVTTPPLFVKGPGSGLILVGTRNGLTALDGEDLRALGRVALDADSPRGVLAAEDLDGNGIAEVIMLTDRGRIVAVNASDGKILWEASGGTDAETVAFADVNEDQCLDVLVAGGQVFAMALSGRDGSVIWKAEEQPVSVANHATALVPRDVVAVPAHSGLLLIAGDPARIGLRAIEFPKARVRPNAR